jgi:LuxR family maltose regulon positive regulatory protein
MARTLPSIEGNLLRPVSGGDQLLAVETPEWYAWLEEHTSFAFNDAIGSFTARKERRRSGGWYWKAYRRRAGKLVSAYLGRSADLSLVRLQAAARMLAGEAAAPAEPAAEPVSAAAPRPPNVLLRTKFFMPLIRARRVERPRLLNQLRDDTQPLVLVAAPAGYGKTTLVVEWIITDGRAAAWASLDSSDNDPIHFWTAVATTLDMLQPGVGTRALGLLQSTQPPPAVVILPVLLNDLTARLHADPHGRPAQLVLDDYHVIEARAVHETVEMLLDHLPPTLRLVIASRTDPPLPLPGLRVRNQLAEVRAADLAFTNMETVAFLGAAAGVSLDTNLAGALASRTEGWVAALQLVALSLRDQRDPATFIDRFHGNNRQLLNYLIGEVLNHQLEFVQKFLLSTSILDRMCAELCDAVLGLESPDPTATRRAPRLSQAMLNHLEATNLFLVALDAEGHWYRYHHLFADVLRDQLRHSDPDLEPTLRLRAAAWYERAGYSAEAIEQALAAHDWDRAARLIGASAETLWRRGEFGTLDSWLDRLPEALVRELPRLGFARICTLMSKMQIDVVLRLLDNVESGLAREAQAAHQATYARPDPPLATLQARLLAIRAKAARLLGDGPSATLLAHQALAALPPDDDWRAEALVDLAMTAYYNDELRAAQQFTAEATALAQAAGNHYLALYTLALRTLILHDRGRLGEADALLMRSRRLAAEWEAQDLSVMGFHDLIDAIIHYDRNDLAGAERLAQRGAQRARSGRLAWFEAYYGVFTMLLRLAQHDPDRALQAIDDAEGHFANMIAGGHAASPWRQTFVAAWRARVQAACADLPPIAHWADAMTAQVDLATAPMAYWFYRSIPLMLARAQLLRGDTQAALALLEQLCMRASAAGADDALIEILVLQAHALAQTQQAGAASEALAQALALGEPQGYIQPFIGAGVRLADQLRAARARGIAPEYITTILAALPQAKSDERTAMKSEPDAHPSPLIVHPLAEPLTPRELEILSLIAEGLSNQQIAQRLIISEDTVKSHTRSIHGKLGVQRRTQAVARARALGLIP